MGKVQKPVKKAKYSSFSSSSSSASSSSSSPSSSSPPRSLFVGVNWHSRMAQWHVQIKIEGRNSHLGYFEDETIAARIYDEQATLLGKPVNFPLHEGMEQAVKRRKDRSEVPNMNRQSKFVGVTWHRLKKKWMTQIMVENQRRNLGYFIDESEAARKYDEQAALLRKPVNFPSHEGQMKAVKPNTRRRWQESPRCGLSLLVHAADAVNAGAYSNNYGDVCGGGVIKYECEYDDGYENNDHYDTVRVKTEEEACVRGGVPGGGCYYSSSSSSAYSSSYAYAPPYYYTSFLPLSSVSTTLLCPSSTSAFDRMLPNMRCEEIIMKE